MFSYDVPQTQNTAPVLDFLCLYTQDLRRKQKRWQDGRLKFHTFNRRVMVYDERSNFVGDAHWREDFEFGEGKELELERGGIRVEVGECVGKREQDLTELVDKRIKQKEERAATKASAGTPAKRPTYLIRTQETLAPHLRPKPLKAMLTPTGHYGRAVLPDMSSFDQRQWLSGSNKVSNENEPPAKRRKQNELAPSKNGYAQNLMGPTLTLASARPPNTATIRYEPVKATPTHRTEPIDLTLGDNQGTEQPGAKQGATRIVTDSETRSLKIQKRCNRSPSSRSGYARSLTGAALTLSRPENITDKRSLKVAAAEISYPGKEQVPGSSSSPEDKFLDIELLRSKQVASKATENRTNSPKRTSLSQSRSSSPALPDRIPLVFNSAKDPPRTSSSSVAGLTGEQPVSALRIKARPPRKMMMLMERPCSRLRTPSVPSSRVTPSAPPNAESAPNEVVLSQATIQLNAFCLKQEERLEARLNSKGVAKVPEELEDFSISPEKSGINHMTIDMLLSRNSIPIARSEPAVKFPPSKKTSIPTGEGKISLIPAIKSRGPTVTSASELLPLSTPETSTTLEILEIVPSKPNGQRLESRTSSPKIYQVPEPKNVTVDSSCAGERESGTAAIHQPRRILSAERNVRSEAVQQKLQDKPPLLDRTSPTQAVLSTRNFDEALSPFARYDEVGTALASEQHTTAETGKDEMAPETTSQPVERDTPLRQTLYSPPAQKYESEAPRNILRIESDGSVVGHGSYPLNPDSDHVRKYRVYENAPIRPVQEDWMSRIQPSELSTLPINPAATLPQHLSGAIKLAKDHFRTNIKSSDSLSTQNQGLNSQLPEAFTETTENPPPRIPPANLVSAWNEFTTKLSPKPSTLNLDASAPRSGPGTWADIEATPKINMVDIPKAPVPQSVPGVSAMAPTKVKLANSATRGKLGQTLVAATTVDMIAPVLNTMAPPPSRTTNRREGVCPTLEIAGRPSGGPVKDTTNIGPWSRESFDFFGTWRPPSRDRPSANAVTS